LPECKEPDLNSRITSANFLRLFVGCMSAASNDAHVSSAGFRHCIQGRAT
jgi:hypothetical protein